MKCDELKQVEYPIEWGLYYDKAEVDAAIAELKARIQLDDDEMAGFLQLEEECGGGDLRNYIAELKRKLEDVQASAYAESVDAGMRERRLHRALWLLKNRYFWVLMVYASDLAKVANPSIIHESNFLSNPTPRCMEEYQHEAELYDNARIKCLKKAEEYK